MSDALPTPDRMALLEHRAWVRALARRLVRDENDVDDVEQETWATALRTGPAEPRALRSWLGVVASRLALQRLRGETRRARREEVVALARREERSPADVVAEADAHGHVVQAVLALDEPYRTTVLMRYFEGLEVADVARRMSVPVETVRTRIKRALERLRTSLSDDEGRPLAIVLAPLAMGTGEGAPPIGRGAPSSGTTSSAAATFARAAALAVAAVTLVAATSWMLAGSGTWDGERGSGGRAVAAASPRDGVADGAGAGANNVPPANAAAPAPPAPVPDDAKERPAAAPVPAADPWIAYDLADGKPLGGFELRVRTATGERVVRTDDAGRLPVARGEALDVAAKPPGTWTLALPENGAVKDEPSLWFWRERGVSGSVKSAVESRPLGPADVRFSWTAPFDMSGNPDTPGSGFRWLMVRGFAGNAERPVRVRAGPDGRLSGTVPGVRGSTLTAEADDFSPAAGALAWSGTGDGAVALVLHPAIHVVGRVLDESGNPVVGQEVSLDTSIDVATDDDLAKARALRPHGGFTYAGKPGRGVVTLIGRSTTDVRGIFKLDATAVGTSVVSVFRTGCLVCRKDLGAMEKDAVGFDMKLERSAARVLVRDAGVPLASAQLVVQVADNRENGFLLTTDADGKADFGWLQRGRWYRIARHDDPTPGRSGCVRWDDLETLDLDQLDKEPKDQR